VTAGGPGSAGSPGSGSAGSGPGPGSGSGSGGLAARLRVARGDFRLDLDLDVAPGEVVALLGPNGAGKSTVLGALAGLVPADGSDVVLDGQVLDGQVLGGRVLGATGPADATRASSAPRASVPARDRPVGTVFQDHRLFPHLTALENVAFGLRARGVPAAEARARAHVELERVGLGDLARRRPGELSGGQSQRVAVARALAPGPRLLLLDEPLAALDATARVELRAALAELLGAVAGPTVLVTHDPVDAVALAQRVVVVEHGRAVQQGRPAAVLLDPHSPYAASLTGATVWTPERVHLAAGGLEALLPGGGTVRSTRERATEGPSRVAFPAEAVTLRPPGHDPSGGAGPAPLPARVLRVEQRLSRLAVTVVTDAGGLTTTAEVPLEAVGAPSWRPGAAVVVQVDPSRVTLA